MIENQYPIQTVTVYCSSSLPPNPAYAQMAQQLGNAIAAQQWNLVYGGTHLGLMRELALAASRAGAHVTGVIPELIANRGVAWSGCNRLLLMADMATRKQKLAELADAFVVLPGGFGTLEEFTEVATAKHLGIHQKPIVLLNANNFWQPFEQWVGAAIAQGVVSSAYRGLYRICDTVHEAVRYLTSYQPQAHTAKYELDDKQK